MAIDIDSHNENEEQQALEKLKNILDYFKQKPVVLERSKNGGFHVFYRFKYPLDWREKKYIIDKFNVEVRSETKIFRLPLSASYMPVKKINKDFTFEYFTTFQEFFDDFEENKDHHETNNYYCFDGIGGTFDFADMKEQIGIRKEQKPAKLFENTYNNQNFNKVQNTEFYYGAGTRCYIWYTKGALFYWYKKANGDFEHFKDLLLEFDQGSRDLNSYKKDKIIEEAFNWAEKNVKQLMFTKTQISYISNSHYCDDSLQNIIKKLAKEFYFSSEYKVTKKAYNISEKSIESIETLFSEIFGIFSEIFGGLFSKDNEKSAGGFKTFFVFSSSFKL
jgi:hypothetical protein